jgi:glutathione synthase
MKPWLIVLDPVEKLDKHIDTSLFIAECAMKRRVPVYLATEQDLSIEASQVHVRASKLLEVSVGSAPRLEAAKTAKLASYAAIFIRKDPPFDSSYVRLCWLLGTASSASLILNTPDLLLRYHEKMLPMEGLAQGFLKRSDVTPTFLGAPAAAREFLAGQANCILKPFLGHGGRGVEKPKVSDLTDAHLGSDTLAQPYLSEIEKLGDFRVIFIDGKMAGFFSRFPKAGHYLSNVAQGGTPKIVSMSAKQKATMERVAKFLKHLGVFFAGVDLIGTHVSEINITSPSGVRIYANLSGINLADKMVVSVQRRLARRR